MNAVIYYGGRAFPVPFDVAAEVVATTQVVTKTGGSVLRYLLDSETNAENFLLISRGVEISVEWGGPGSLAERVAEYIPVVERALEAGDLNALELPDRS